MEAKINNSGSSKPDSMQDKNNNNVRTKNNAVLASVLLFPGAGHIILNKRVIGIGLILVAGLAFIALTYDAFKITQEIAQEIVASGTIPSVFALRDMIYDALLAQNSPRFKACISVLFGAWLIGIIDTVRYRFSTRHS